MTAAAQSPVSISVLTDRLAFLRSERDRTRSEILPEGAGDVADRATNVDGLVRLSMLEERIAALEDELAEGERAATPTADGVVAPGRVVTLDLGDGPETFLLGSFEQLGGDFEVITSGSPLGRALAGAQVGSTVSYAARASRHLKATVLAVN